MISCVLKRNINVMNDEEPNKIRTFCSKLNTYQHHNDQGPQSLLQSNIRFFPAFCFIVVDLSQ